MPLFPRRILLCLSLFLVPTPSHASVLDLRPAPPPGWIDVDPDDSSRAIARLEAIEDSLLAESDELSDEMHLALARLCMRTGRPEYRDPGLEHARRAQETSPEQLAALLVELQLLSRDDYTKPPLLRLSQRSEDFTDDAAFHYAHGYYLFERGIQLLDAEKFRGARDAFLRAARTGERNPTQRMALAAAGQAAHDPEAVIAATGPLLETQPHHLPALLLRACARVSQSNYAQADDLFRRAMDLLPGAYRDEFENATTFLQSHEKTRNMDAPEYWRMVDGRPTEIWNDRRLRFWRRMVEADLFFGDGESPGWLAAPGDAWVRFGPPLGTVFRPWDPIILYPSRSRPGPRLEYSMEQDLGRNPLPMAPGWNDFPETYRQAIDKVYPTRMELESNLWFWIYQNADASIFALGFTNVSFDNQTWRRSGMHMAESEKRLRVAPLYFPERPPVPTFRLNVALAGYLPEREASSLETLVSVEPLDDASRPGSTPPDPTDSTVRHRLRWALYDSDDVRVDHREVPLDDSRRRSRLLEKIDQPEPQVDAWLWQIGARLPEDHYRVAVEAEDLATGYRQHWVLEVELSHRPTGRASMSDLSFVDTFADYRPDTGVPPEFVKHAVVLLPHPEPYYAENRSSMQIYYEIYDLAVDASRHTDYDVAYILLREKDERGEREGSDPEIVRQRDIFTGERLVPSARGMVVKGVEIDLDGLEPGEYEVRIVVRDNLTGERLMQRRHFRLGPNAGSS